MLLPAEVSLREVGPRDGLQAEAPIAPADRARLVDALAAAGLRRIEAASFVSPRAVPAMAGGAQVFSGIQRRPGVTYSALVPNVRGASDALAAGADALQVVVAASESYNRHNVNRSIGETLDEIAGVIRRAGPVAVEGTVSTAWGCPYQGPVPAEDVVRLARRLVDLGCAGISLGDTIGAAVPTSVETLLAGLGEIGVPVNCHFHDGFGTAVANVLTALLAGCADFDVAVGGLGGSPLLEAGSTGNVATGEVVRMLAGMGVRTGVDPAALDAAAELLPRLVGHPLRSRVRAGDGEPAAGAAGHSR